MTSTSVKDVGSVLANLMPAAGNRTAGIGQTGFQTVLNDQTQRNSENQAADSRKPAESSVTGQYASDQKKTVDSIRPKNMDRVQSKENREVNVENKDEELSPEEMEQAMEVLRTAAVELVQQTAELLGIPVEELQSLMEGMGMTELDILDPARLSALFLQAGGVEDSYALVTDEGLYEDYQTLMKQLEVTLQECGGQLDRDPVQVPALLTKLTENPMAQNEASVISGEPVVEVFQEEAPMEKEPVVYDAVTVQDTNPHVDAGKDASASGREHGQKERNTGGGEQQGGNLFLQNLRTEEFRPEVQQPAEAASLAEADSTENIMRQIMDYMKVQLKEDTSSLEMQLHPASLGTVQVQIASRGGMVTANFITQDEAVKAALESQMTQLIERFDEQGVKVEAIEVTVQTHAFERNLEQEGGRGRQNEEPARKGRIRRINLNDAVSMEDMGEEDALAADMMAANGNTVDYTA